MIKKMLSGMFLLGTALLTVNASAACGDLSEQDCGQHGYTACFWNYSSGRCETDACRQDPDESACNKFSGCRWDADAGVCVSRF